MPSIPYPKPIPVLKPLKVALEVTEKLTHLGYDIIVAGGAARDHLLGLPIKDIDLFVIQGSAYEEDVNDILDRVLYAIEQQLPEATDVQVCENYRDNPGRVAYVIKFNYKGVAFDLIEYMEYMPNAHIQVENFDTTLSMAWFAYVDHDRPELVPVPHPRFIETLLTKKVEVLPTLDGPRNPRLEYLQSKYPMFDYPFKSTQQELPLV